MKIKISHTTQPIKQKICKKLPNKVNSRVDKQTEFKAGDFSNARITLERQAEFMDPQEYILSKSYLANLELQQMAKDFRF